MKSVVKADTKIAQGATKGTNPAAKGGESTTEMRKGDEEKTRNHREKMQRTPPPTKKGTSADKHCDILSLMKAPEGLTLAAALKRGNMLPSNPCSDDCEGHVTFNEVTYELCEVHLSMLDACNQTTTNFEASERSDKAKEARAVGPAKQSDHDSGIEWELLVGGALARRNESAWIMACRGPNGLATDLAQGDVYRRRNRRLRW